VSAGPHLGVSPARPEIVTREPPRRRPGWIALMTATDHKQVGILYIGAACSALVIATCLLVLMRVQLIVPENTMIEPVTFERLLSAYGATAIVFFALPLAIGFATYVVPLQIGSRGVAFPRLASLSFWLYLLGAIALYGSFLYTPPEAGALNLPPLSDDAFADKHGVDAWIVGVGLAVLGFVLAALNLVTTLRRDRAPGMAWRRLPPFSWASTVISFLILVAGPVLLAALVMLFIDRNFDGVFFESAQGGGPVLYEHLSWFFFTAAYTAIVVFAAGVISEIVPVLAGKPPFSRPATAIAIAAIGILGPLAWMQNMYSAEIARGWLYMAMGASVALAVPIGVLIFGWIATLWEGALRLRAPLVFALGAISTMSIGLAGELANSVIPVGWQLGNTMAAWQDTHYALIGGAVFAGFAALYYWFPKLTGRTMGEGLAQGSFWTMLIGVNLMCIPMFFAGLEGQPVDVGEYYEGIGVDGYNLLASIGSFVLAIGILLTLVNAVLSVRHGPRAGHDPWLGATLEWFALSPPPEHNFDAIPDVRSAEPLRDIREAVRRGTEGWSVPAPRRRAPVASEAPGSGEPGAAPATTDAERGGGRESPDSLSA
jgi:heme/copper-type cytochrome/quinol oxidase subunit 1